MFPSAVLVSGKPANLWHLNDTNLDVLSMKRFRSLALLLTLAGVSGTTLAANRKPMTLSEVVSGAVQMVPGPSRKLEVFLQAPDRAKGLLGEGGRLRADYKTRDGVLLHIELYTDRRSTSEPSVTAGVRCR